MFKVHCSNSNQSLGPLAIVCLNYYYFSRPQRNPFSKRKHYSGVAVVVFLINQIKYILNVLTNSSVQVRLVGNTERSMTVTPR